MIPGARADQTDSPNITIPGQLEGYQGDGFYLSFNANNTSRTEIRLSNVTVTLDNVSSTLRYGPGSLPHERWDGTSWWVDIPSEETIGPHSVSIAFAFEVYNNNTGSWTFPINSPLEMSRTLLVLPSPARINLAEAIIALPISALFTVLGARAALNLLTRRFAKILPGRSIIYFSVAATLASTLHLTIVQTASLCRQGLVGGGFPLTYAQFPYPLVGYYGPLPLCPLVTYNLDFLNILFFLPDMSFYAIMILGTAASYRLLRKAISKSERQPEPQQPL